MQNQDGKNKITSVRTLIIDGQGHYALARRDARGEQAGLWEFPGGKVDNGETVLDAAIRESKEEMALDIYPLSPPETIESRIIPDGKHAGKPYKALGCFALSQSPEQIAPLDGVDEAGWFTADQIRSMDITPTTRTIVDRLL